MKSLLKSFFTIFFLFITLFFLIACSKKESTDIVTTLYPQYDIAKQIAGDKLSVSLLTPFGSEVHAYEPTAKDIINIKEAKLFLYTSDSMERWVKNVINSNVNAIDLSAKYVLLPYADLTVGDDFHYWTDPTTVLQLIEVIKDEIIKVDPENETYYETNATNYYNEINTVHEELSTYLNSKLNSSVFFYGHNALAPFANRYNLEIISLSDNYQPDAELSPGQILNLKNKIKETNAKYLFVEELIDLRAPSALKDELASEGYQLTLLELHGFHNISKNQNEAGVRYVDLLKQNFENLKTALN